MTKPVLLSESDLECLQMGRSIKVAGMKLVVNMLQAQIELTEKQLHATGAEPPVISEGMHVANGLSAIKPSMLRTLAEAGITPLGLPAPEIKVRKKRGLKPRQAAKIMKGYWAGMTPEQRSIEMQRRKDVTLAKRAGKVVKKLKQPNHPRNADHPKHKQWLAKVRKRSRETWANYSPTVREARINRALEGRGVVPKVKLQKTVR
jgi:hypothetical protein